MRTEKAAALLSVFLCHLCLSFIANIARKRSELNRGKTNNLRQETVALEGSRMFRFGHEG